MVKRLPVVSMIRKRVIRARRNRNHAKRLAEGLAQIRELHGQFSEWRHRWVNRRDEHARQNAVEALREIYRIIRRLVPSNRGNLEAFLRRQRIPGWRKAFAPVRTRSR